MKSFAGIMVASPMHILSMLLTHLYTVGSGIEMLLYCKKIGKLICYFDIEKIK